MIAGYALFCLSFALMTLLTINRQALGIYKLFIKENAVKAKSTVNVYIASGVFFSSMLVLAPILCIPFVLNPNAAARGYGKALISSLELET